MNKFSIEPYQVWFPGELVWELWFVDEAKGARIVDTCADSRSLGFRRGCKRRVLALPTIEHSAYPFVSGAFGETRLLKGALTHMEILKVDGDIQGIGVQPVSGVPPRTLCRIDLPVAGRRMTEFSAELCPETIVPAASLIPIPPNGIAIWTELRNTVVGVEKNGGTIYYELLKGRSNVEYARQVRNLLPKLRHEKICVQKPSLHLWNQFDPILFNDVVGLEIVPGVRPAPSNKKASIGIRPRRYREMEAERRARKKTRMKSWIVGSVIAMVVFTMMAALEFALIQTTNQKGKISEMLPEANRLQFIKDQWEEMSPVIDPSASLLEIWRHISALQSVGDVRIKEMAIERNTIKLVGEAADNKLVLRYMDELSRSASMASYSWDFSEPEVLRDGTTLFVFKGFKL